ncbi:MAG TPA: hypothetical protein VGY75_10600 [Candidatus Udaeobacter sp.]|jgi:hypothetical protein|nr:hypothetical protein [Candidatus Udaeobacter sp.]
MNAPKFSIVNLEPLRRGGCVVPNEYVMGFLDGSNGDEEHDAFIRRYNKEPEPTVIVRQIAPEIAPLLNAPWPNYDMAAVAEAAKLESGVIFQTRWLNCSAAEALEGL